MAIVKHIKSRNANYSAAIDYLLLEHDKKTEKKIVDESGNIHTHIAINSVRKTAVERQPYMDKPHEEAAGYKHQSNLRTLNDQSRYTGQYYANKEVYFQFSNAKFKEKYRKDHAKEIQKYEEARDWLLYQSHQCREA